MTTLGAGATLAAWAASVPARNARKSRGSRCLCRAETAEVAKAKAEPEAEEEAPAPAEPVKERKMRPFNPAKQPGVTEPLGYFDPLGFCKIGDRETFYQYRCAEIKHGRVAMMAALGAVVQPWWQFFFFWDVPKGVDAAWTPPGSYGFGFLLFFSGALELIFWAQKPFKEPGDFGDPLGFGIYDKDMRNRELNNGRAAMFAAIGIIAANLYTGKDAMEQLGIVVPRNFDDI